MNTPLPPGAPREVRVPIFPAAASIKARATAGRDPKPRGPALPAIAAILAALACAIYPGGPAVAQTFKMLGKGVDISGLVMKEVVDTGMGEGEPKTGAGSLSLRVKSGVLMATGMGECSVNGTPTEVGMVFVSRGAYSRSFACDPARGGTESQGGEVRRTATIKTTTSVAGNVVTLNALIALTQKVVVNEKTVARDAAFSATQATQKLALRLRIEGRNCTVLAYSNQTQKIIDRGDSNRFSITQRTAMGPSTTCRLVD